jgi:hypothetical protein
MAVELRNLLTRTIGASLPATLLFDHPSIEAVTDYVMRTLKLLTPVTSDVSTHAELAALSDEEAEAQLLAELASLDSGSVS